MTDLIKIEPKRKVPLERTLEKKLIDFLNRHNIFHHKGLTKNLKGFPDRVIYFDKIYYVELKNDKGVISPLQRLWKAQITESAGVHLFIKGDKELQEFLKELESKKVKIKNHFKGVYNK